jgi:hypothetical protein
MIGLSFSLSGMLIFMLYIMVNDFLILVSSIVRDVEANLSHDTHFFPDDYHAQ